MHKEIQNNFYVTEVYLVFLHLQEYTKFHRFPTNKKAVIVCYQFRFLVIQTSSIFFKKIVLYGVKNDVDTLWVLNL